MAAPGRGLQAPSADEEESTTHSVLLKWMPVQLGASDAPVTAYEVCVRTCTARVHPPRSCGLAWNCRNSPHTP